MANVSFDTLVGIGLKATGPDPRRDRMLALALTVREADGTTRSYRSLIHPEGPLTPAILVAGGADREALAAAPPLDRVMADVLEFLPGTGCVLSRNAALERAFLHRAAKGLVELPFLDTVDLARVCLPGLDDYSLDRILAALDEPPVTADGVGGPAQGVLSAFLRLRERVEAMPEALRSGVWSLLRGLRNCEMRHLFKGGKPGTGGRATALVPLFEERAFPRRHAAADPEAFAELSTDDVAALFLPDGPFASALGAYEHRGEQVAMVRGVLDAFNRSRHLLVEAGTGIGKSLAYLVPSVLWALINETPVVVSTNTKNLQTQLYRKDLPLIARVLRTPFRSTMIKGRRNYLCLRKLLHQITYADVEVERAERLPLAQTLVWAASSESGDMAESPVGPGSPCRELAGRLVSVAEECPGGECSLRRRCFLQRVRAEALASDVVVANHSVVFSEMGLEQASPVLPPHHHVVFDEAHNVEDAATGALSREVSLRRVTFIAGRLRRAGRRRKARGLLPALEKLAKSLPGDAAASVTTLTTGLAAALEALETTYAPFFGALEALLPQASGKAVRRIRPEGRLAQFWAPLVAAKESLVGALGRVRQGIDPLCELLEDVGLDPEANTTLGRELQAVKLWFGEFVDDTELVLKSEDPDWVYWVERVSPKQGGARACAAPVDVGPMLRDMLYEKKESVVFTSATLAVRGTTDFIKRRLGVHLLAADRVTEMTIGTPFDYRSQCLVLVPTFLPEPGDRGRDYPTELAYLLAELFLRTQGRAMALFTSYDMLRRCTNTLIEELEGEDILVLAQGLSGPRDRITERFRRELGSVLMGTHSFWEGVDIPGESLSCLVLARLPFPVHTDPIVEARAERLEAEGTSAFFGYSLPAAVIRFRQGFGRLLRHRHDRGVIIISDRRLATRSYGEWFRASMPTHMERYSDWREMLEVVAEFLETPGPNEDPHPGVV